MILSTKKVFLKSPAHIKAYKDKLPTVSLAPEPVVIRWGTWIEAVLFFNQHFDAIKDAVNDFGSTDCLMVRQCKEAFEDSSIKKSIAMISTYFTHMPERIKKLESHRLTLNESIQLMSKIRQLNSELPEIFLHKLK